MFLAAGLTAPLVASADDGADTQVLHDNYRWMGLILGLDTF